MDFIVQLQRAINGAGARRVRLIPEALRPSLTSWWISVTSSNENPLTRSDAATLHILTVETNKVSISNGGNVPSQIRVDVVVFNQPGLDALHQLASMVPMRRRLGTAKRDLSNAHASAVCARV